MLFIFVLVCSWLSSCSLVCTISSHSYHFWHISNGHFRWWPVLLIFLIFLYESSSLSLLNKITILLVTQVLDISALSALSSKKYSNIATFLIQALEASFASHIATSFLSHCIDQCRLLFFYTSDSSAFLHFTITTALAEIRSVNLFFLFFIALSSSCPSSSKRSLTNLSVFFPPVHVCFAIVPSRIML